MPILESGSSDCSQTPIRSDPASISHLAREKIFRKKVKFGHFFETPKFEAFLDPVVCEDVEDAQQVQASTTYPQEGLNPSLFQSLKQGLLPAGPRDLTKISSTVVAGEQVESQLCNERREKIFAERKDTTLSGKLVNDPPVRGLHGEAFIKLKEGAKPKKQCPYENHAKKHEVFCGIIQRNLQEFGWLEACMTSEWCCAPFTVPKPPRADQNSLDGWRMVVDLRNLDAETKADSNALPLIEKEIVKGAKGEIILGPGFKAWLSPDASGEVIQTPDVHVQSSGSCSVDSHACGLEECSELFPTDAGWSGGLEGASAVDRRVR